MAFLKKHAFKLALWALCALMGIYLLSTLQIGGPPMENEGPAPDFALENLEGETVTLADTAGKVRLFYFYFTNCPDVCPPTTAQLAQVQETLKARGLFGSDVLLTSITIDPERDTAERIREYSELFNVDYSGWQFLRGSEEAVDALARAFKLMVIRVGGDVSHSNYIFFVDRNGDMRGSVSPDDWTLDEAEEELMSRIDRLLKEDET